MSTILKLEIISPDAPPGTAARHDFSREGGTIGRAGTCDWVLAHRKVSGRHALITYSDGLFYITDEESGNGVFLNSTRNRLIAQRRYALKAGDRIIIDPYEIAVSIQTGRTTPQPFDDLSDRPYRDDREEYLASDLLDPFSGRRTPDPIATSATPLRTPAAGEVVPLEELDPMKLLGGGSKRPPVRQVPSVQDLDRASDLEGHYQPPAVEPAAATPASAIAIPPDYDPLAPDDPIEAASPAPPFSKESAEEGPATVMPDFRSAQTQAVAQSSLPPAAVRPVIIPSPASEMPRHGSSSTGVSDPGLVTVLESAGLATAPVTVEFARSLGRIFRVVVEGVMDVLRARQQIKDEFRMQRTHFRVADNNPLKFSANVDDALHNLLVKRNAAYLEPVEAFEDAFHDLRDHQIAMLAGMRVAFESMVEKFNPEELQKDFDRHLKRVPLLGMTAKLRYWELFCEKHEELAKDPEAAFRTLFGDEFGKAYEEQLRRLKNGTPHHAPPRPSDV